MIAVAGKIIFELAMRLKFFLIIRKDTRSNLGRRWGKKKMRRRGEA